MAVLDLTFISHYRMVSLAWQAMQCLGRTHVGFSDRAGDVLAGAMVVSSSRFKFMARPRAQAGKP